MPEQLIETLERQEEILAELLDIVVQQREVIKSGKLAELQELMSEMRRVSVRCQAIETKRVRVAEELASRLQCSPIVADIIVALPEDQKESLQGVAQLVAETVGALKVEMQILPRLMEEAKALNEMLISEWRRMNEEAGSVTGGFDAKI